MKWWRRKEDFRTEAQGERDKQQLIQEIRKAHTDWSVAQQRLDYFVEKDQIDYAIVCLEAAEKRYEMLLRQAKRSQVCADEFHFTEVATVVVES